MALLVHGMRVWASPDIYGDEGLYYLVAHNLATGKGLQDDTGTFFWHPPVYPILEAAWIRIAGLDGLPMVDGILASRWINVAFSAATAGLIFVFTRDLAGTTRAGVLAAALFVADLFVQRINRRSMLETVTELLIVLGLWLFWRWRARSGVLPAIVVGAVFGLAILAKEVAGIGLLAMLGYAVLFDRTLLRRVLAIIAIAATMYAAYVGWAVSAGEWDRFVDFKLGSFERLFGHGGRAFEPQEPGTPPPAVPTIFERLGPAFGSYGPTYVLMAVGGILSVVLLLTSRARPGIALLCCWSLASFIAIGWGQTGDFGDQFFYYVLVPAIIVVAVAVEILLEDRRVIGRWPRVAVAMTLLALFAWGGIGWVQRSLIGRDDAYVEISRYVRDNLPRGTALVVGADVANFTLRPEYRIEFLRDRRSVEDAGIQYFILSSKEAALGYNRVTPEFYEWVLSKADPVLVREGATFWTLGLYRARDAAAR